MGSYAFDIEVFPNFWSCTFLDTNSPDDIRTFVISWDLKIDDKEKLQEFITNNVEILIGYNSLFYDNLILSHVLEYDGKNINKDIFDLSTRIISSDRGENYRNKKNLSWKSLDLMKMMAFDKLGVSLKQCAINLKWKKIQDLPLPYDHIVTREDIELIIQYNINDVLITNELYKTLAPQINLRKELGNIYNVDIVSASDSKIANVLLENIYSTETGVDIKQLKNLRTKRDFLWLKDCICPGIRFKTKKLRNLLFETINTLVVAENNYAYKKEIQFGNCTYELGVGGLHTEDQPDKFVSDENYIVRDLDVASYYPNIIINNKIKPDHLNEDFIAILKKITKERLEAKKSGDKIKADGLKITVNSIFGKLGSETFWLEDAKAMLTVTVSGQLYLLMLVEALTLAGIIVISTNTDGIVCKIPRNIEKEYKEICNWWQKETGFESEYNDYDLYIRTDVNNYIVKKSSGETKEKGRYLKELDLKKGYHYPIVPRCLYEYFINGKSVDETMSEATDALDFCISQKTGKDFSIEYRTEDNVEPMQKTNRFYISKSGGAIVKTNRETGSEIGLYVGKLSKILNDYDSTLPIESYDIDYDFYKEEALKYIADIENSTFPETLIQEELSGVEEDGLELEIDKFDTSNITIKPAKFRYSKASYFYDKRDNTIYRGIASLKYVTSNVATELEKVEDQYFPTFVDLLIAIEENCSVNSRQLETLIRLNYFEEFGKNKKLINIYLEFSKGKNKYAKTLKDTTRLKRKEILIEYEKTIANEKINILEQVFFEIDLLNYPQTTFDIDKRYVYVMKLDEKYSPKLTCICLQNNKSTILKVQKKLYENYPILGGDIIYCDKFEQKKAVNFVDGEFVEDETKPKVWWLSKWHVLTKEEIAVL